MLRLIKKHPIAATGFALASAFVLFFCAKLVADAVYWADPKHREQPPAAWMTPRYIAHSWKLDPKRIAEAIDHHPDEIKGRPTLKRIAQKRGVSVEDLILQIETVLAAQP